MLKSRSIIAVILSLCVMVAVQAEERLKPFVLASIQSGDMAEVVDSTRSKLKSAGFKIAGEYSPYDGVVIIGVTNKALKDEAAKSQFGIFAVAQRVSVTKGKDGKIQVAYTNPVYMAQAYRLKGDLSDVAAELGKALGAKETYGSEKGLTAKKLRDYQYKWLMPYFDDLHDLADYDSYKDAVKKIEKHLEAGQGGVKEVYRIDLPGKEATLFAVHMTEKTPDECAGDKYIMDKIDFKDIKSSAHLPYEIVVRGNHAYALRAEFRIAISFPDLSMMGSNSFASIMCAPSAIEEALTIAVGGEMEE